MRPYAIQSRTGQCETGGGMGYLDDSLPDEQRQNRIISEIVELQREFFFENRNKDSERRRRLRDVIERATPQSRR